MIFIPHNVASSKNSKINTSKGSFISKTTKKYLRSLGIQSFSSSKKEVKLYKTIPLSFPVKELKNELKNGELEIIPMKGLPMTSHWNLVWLTSKKLSPVAAAFLDYVKENKEAVIEQHFKQYDIL